MTVANSPKIHNSERLFLLDGMALAYRAYFSFISRPLINSKGENTSAIFGFVNTLMKILNDEKPEHIAVVFDTKEPTFRHKMYEPYKATRQKMPEDMSSQLDKLKEVVRAFNVPSLELPGYEADDIMGTLARKAERQKINTFLVTGDKDFMQLISSRIKMYKPGKQGDEWEIIDEKGVHEKFGVAPEFVIDMLGLIGDKSDNVPGVPGVGEKTATPLIQQYKTIENLYKHIDNILQKGLKDKLILHKDKALLSKELVTIDCNVPIDVDIHHLEAKPFDREKLIQLFTELEFKALLKKVSSVTAPQKDTVEIELPKSELTDIKSDEHTYHLVDNEKEFHKLVKILANSKEFVFDTETTSTNPLQAELVGLSFSLKSKEAWYVPVRSEQRVESGESRLRRDKLQAESNHQSDLFSTQTMPDTNISHPTSHIYDEVGLPLSLLRDSLSPIFSNPKIKKIGQNIKYDMLVLASHGVQIRGELFDTMVANYILRPDGQHNLDSLAKEHLNYKMISFDDLTGTGKERKDIRDIHPETVGEYSNEDADFTQRLYEFLREKLNQQKLNQLAEEVEFPLIPVLAEMELTGVKLDINFLADFSKELEKTLDNLTTVIYQLSGENFNINSTQQLGKILFDKLKLRTGRKTKTGYSTDVGTLETIRHEHPLIGNLLEFRQLQKLKSTYVDALPSLINPRTGKLHTSYNQTVTVTGRLSSSDPNLQNIPIRTEIGSRMRRAFIPSEKGMVIISADYSQIELRVMAHISHDEGLIEAFRNGEDIHATTAAKIFGVSLDDVSKDMRRKAKEVNFGIMYGIGPYGLATRLDIPQAEAKEIITKYFERFPKVKQYINDTIETAKRNGYVSTLLGRRRYFPDINSRNQNIRGNAERQAINMPIQGTAADMIKLAMIRIYSKIRNPKSGIRMLMQVHDELVFETAKSQELIAKSLIGEEMKNALPLSVPIEVEIGVGKNWLEAH
ncbi:MAG: DNA polymerase I [Chlorobiaceae bacterium]|nr:DNA polymerase I [Chlorobiaceae bacterium]